MTLTLVGAYLLLPAAASAHDTSKSGAQQRSVQYPGELEATGRVELIDRGKLTDRQAPFALNAMGPTPCVGGFAGMYPCRDVDLLAFLPLAEIGGGHGNDVWGWTDSLTGREYALMGRTTGTSFVDISDPSDPVYLGDLPTHTASSIWRGIKVFADHAFIVSEAGSHGMQVFDLTTLRSVAAAPVTFTATAHYSGVGSVHTIAVNEASGFVYLAGSKTCNGGLHIVDVRVPASPIFAGCVSNDGYTHETQCVTYHGPDPAYYGREICFSSNGDTLTIVDVTDKAAPVQLSRTGYAGSGYTHQGWLTEDHAWFLMDDEKDELNFHHNTRTYVWDVTRLTAPNVDSVYEGPSTAIDHNQYIRGNHAFQANYRSGLRVIDLSGIAAGTLREVGFFDIYPADDLPSFNGAWSNYPFFASGVVVVSGIEQGLFVLRPILVSSGSDLVVSLLAPPTAAAGDSLSVTDTTSNLGADPVGPSVTRFYLSADPAVDVGDAIVGAREVPALATSAASTGATTVTIPAATPPGSYYLVAKADADGAIMEGNELNNTVARRIGVGPDVIVSALSTPATSAPGRAISVSETTLNQGASRADGSTTRFYLSTAATYSPADPLIGSRAIAPLAPGAWSAGVATLTIPPATAAGTYFVVARGDADGTIAEANEANNTRSVAIRIAVPDLIISALSGPVAAAAGGSISVNDTTRNASSAGTAGPSTTRIYLSANATFEAGDVLLGSRAVPELAPQASSTVGATLVIPAGTATGNFYLIARADADGLVVEASEANNTRSTPIRVSPPDLTVAALSAPPRGGAGLPVVVTDTTRNQTGVGPATTSATRFYLARSSVLVASDPSIGERAIPQLAPGASSVGTTTLMIPPATTAGAYFIVAKADGPGALVETLEGNNTRAAAIAIGPDLAVTAMSAPATGGAGLPLTVTDTVTNQAGGAAASSTLRFYLSTNATFDPGDILLGSRLVPSLAPGVGSPGSTSLTIPPGTAAAMYYIVAVADAGGEVDEINEANNARAVAVKVAPDLVVVALAAPASARAGATISVTDTTKNQGEGTAAATTTRFYLSTNASYDVGDVSLNSRAVPSLATLQASAATTVLTIPGGTPPGAYYLVALADADGVVGELHESNNTRVQSITIVP